MKIKNISRIYIQSYDKISWLNANMPFLELDFSKITTNIEKL